MLIDFHTHIFPDHIAEKTIDLLGRKEAHIYPFTNGTLSGLQESMKNAEINYSVTLPVMTNTKQVDKLNRSIMEEAASMLENGIISFGGMHPDYESIEEMIKELKRNDIKGIKLHPAYQGADLNDIRMKRIIYTASEQDMIVLVHSGLDIGLYDRNYASVPHVLEILRELAPPKLVLAHMGNWGAFKEVESDLAGAPVWFDTSFCLGQITQHPDSPEPPAMTLDLTSEDFIRLSRKHGTDKILFATDSPWMDQKQYVEIIRQMPLTQAEQSQILYQNAQQLLNI